jgi:uncharacterized DUF497 family protein
MDNCGSCTYFSDHPLLKVGPVCTNEKNKPSANEFMVVPDINYSCSHYKKSSIEDQFEWDTKKNEINKQKHQIEFERVYDLFQDPNMHRLGVLPDKWEKLDDLDFEAEGIERNIGNENPVRSIMIGMIDGKLYTAAYTLRNGFENMKMRIISLRPSQAKEITKYENIKKGKSLI